MTIRLVDDEKLVLAAEEKLIRRCAPEDQVYAFQHPDDALAFLRRNGAQVAFLDLEMPEYNGIELAKRMKSIAPRLNIIFATAHREYFGDAAGLHPSGYLLKPLDAEHVMEELKNLRYPVEKTAERSDLFVRTFGNFEVFYRGYPLIFKLQKTKELFAYLIDRRGALVSRDELVTILWGGEQDKTSYFKQVQKDLTDTLAGIGKKDLLIKARGTMGLLASEIDCDYYDWLKGKPEGLNAFMGEYMRQYSWAESTLANIVMKEGFHQRA